MERLESMLDPESFKNNNNYQQRNWTAPNQQEFDLTSKTIVDAVLESVEQRVKVLANTVNEARNIYLEIATKPTIHQK